MRFFLSILSILLINILVAQQPSPSAAAQWDKILLDAKNQQKIILLDFYTSWCGPCKAMDARVFPDTTVSNTLQEHYSLIKLDAEQDELGRLLAARYMVGGYPTYLIIDPSLSVLRKDSGYKDAVKNPQKSIAGFSRKKYLDFPEFYLASFGEKKNKAKTDTSLVRNYLDGQQDLTSETAWAVMNAFPMAEKHFKYFMDNYSIYKEKYGSSIERKIAYGLFPELEKAIANKSTKDFVAVLNKIEPFFDDPGEQQSTYLFNIPREREFYVMKVNFLDSAQTITPQMRLNASNSLLMQNDLPEDASKKVISWLTSYPNIEQTTDPYLLISLALAYQQLGDKEQSTTFFTRGQNILGKNENEKNFVEYIKNKLNL